MYDTVNISLTSDRLDLLEIIPKYIVNPSFDTGTSSGQTYYKFKSDNLTVYINQSKCNIGGSFCKFLHGNNLVNFTRKDMELVTEKLNDTFHVSFEDSKVSRVDFSYNFDLSLPPESYYYHLGELPYYKRLEQLCNGVEGLYYSCTTDNKQLVFYNKIKELQKNDGDVPVEYRGRNILRYEMRLKRKPGKMLGYDRITLGMLSDETVYGSVLKLWKDNYFNIGKLHDVIPNLTDFSGYKGIKNLAMLDYINRNGGMMEFLKMIDNQYNRGSVSKRDRDEIKRQVKLLVDSHRPPEITNTTIHELDSLVKSL